MRARPKRTGYAGFSQRLVLFFHPVATEAAVLFPQKKVVGWPTFTASSVGNSESWMRWTAKAATFQIRPCGQERWKRGMRRDSSAQVGHRDTVLLKGNESKTQAHGVRGFLPEARFIFSSPSPQSPPSSSPSKRSWGGQDGPVGLRCQRFHSRISCVRSREHNKQISYLQSITR